MIYWRALLCLISLSGLIFCSPFCTKKYILLVNDRQEYDVREERRKELEFLEKVWQFDHSLAIHWTPFL